MKIAAGTVVTFHYRLFEQGNEQALEDSHGGEPMAYLHGHNNIISGLESEMADKSEGDAFTADVAAEFAYGLRRDDAVQRVPIKHLHNHAKLKNKLKPGMLVHINTNNGAKQATVIKAGRFNVDVDTNHPLAGKNLRFEVEVVSVREATAEEVSHGHAHGPGGHQH